MQRMIDSEMFTIHMAMHYLFTKKQLPVIEMICNRVRTKPQHTRYKERETHTHQAIDWVQFRDRARAKEHTHTHIHTHTQSTGEATTNAHQLLRFGP